MNQQERRLMIRILALSFGLACVAQPVLAQQEQAAVRDACAKDIATHCPAAQSDGGRVAACFKEKSSQLSEGCVKALEKANAAR